MLNTLANYLDDLTTKLDILTFKINQKIKKKEETRRRKHEKN